MVKTNYEQLHWFAVDRHVVDVEQLFLVKDHLLAGEADHVVFRGQFDSVNRAGFLAHAAKNAAQFVNFKACRVFFPVFPGALRGLNMDAPGRADSGAHHACHTLHAALLVPVQAVDAPEVAGVLTPIQDREVLPSDFGVLHGSAGPPLSKAREEMPKRGPEPLHDLGDIHAFQRGKLGGVQAKDVLLSDGHGG